MATDSVLQGLYVLVVEDDFFLADALVANLNQRGAVVIGPVPSIAKAIRLVSASPLIDVAVLDANLGGELCTPVAEHLQAAGIPFVLATGYDDSSLPDAFNDVPICQKPMDMNALEGAVERLLQRASDGRAHA